MTMIEWLTTSKLSRKQKRDRALALLVVLALMATGISAGLRGFFGAALANRIEAEAEEVPVIEHIVVPGDTLWDIAEQYRPDRDPREVIAQIQQINGITDGKIYPGQKLKIPLR